MFKDTTFLMLLQKKLRLAKGSSSATNPFGPHGVGWRLNVWHTIYPTPNDDDAHSINKLKRTVVLADYGPKALQRFLKNLTYYESGKKMTPSLTK